MRQQFYAIITILFLLLELSSCAQSIKQNKKGYTINKAIHSEVDKRIIQFNKQANANVNFKIYEGDKIIGSSNALGEAGLSFTTFFENCIVINCLNGIEDGFGFDLLLNNDHTTNLKFKILPKFDINATEEIPQELSVPCVSSKIVLSAKPTFMKGELVEGMIELESEYFTTIVDKAKRELKFKLEVYFRSEPLPVIDGKYLTLEKIINH